MFLNNNREYLVEVSFAPTKLVILAVRKRKFYTMELPKKQAWRIIYDICGSCRAFIKNLRISQNENLYIEGLKDMMNMSLEKASNKRNMSKSDENHFKEGSQYDPLLSERKKINRGSEVSSKASSSQVQLTPINRR